MIKAIAIDDEKNALGIISEFSERIPDLNLTETFTDPVKALAHIAKNPEIDLIFLDIQMTRLNGLTLAQHIPEGKTKIILTTAYPDYALQGYELDIIDYLLKPFSFQRFEKAVTKAKTALNLHSPITPSSTALDQNKIQTDGEKFIFIRTDYKTIRVNIADIKYIEGSGNYVTLHTVKQKILSLQNMKTFEEQLLSKQFIRIHKSFIASLQHIDTIERNAVKIGSIEIPIGESYRDSFHSFLKLNFKQF